MSPDSSDTTSTVPELSASPSGRGIIVTSSIAMIATVLSLFFLMGFFSAWLKSEGDWMALVTRGLKFAASGSLGVLCIGISAKSWQRLPVPAWLPSTASFAVGFFVMNGLGEAFDGRYENILPKAGGGLLLGACIGLGIYLAQRRKVGQRGASGTSGQNPSVESDK